LFYSYLDSRIPHAGNATHCFEYERLEPRLTKSHSSINDLGVRLSRNGIHLWRYFFALRYEMLRHEEVT
jgi:hypothetical protein